MHRIDFPHPTFQRSCEQVIMRCYFQVRASGRFVSTAARHVHQLSIYAIEHST
jgi:hypothetical protein